MRQELQEHTIGTRAGTEPLIAEAAAEQKQRTGKNYFLKGVVLIPDKR
jgi:hypothetical protein